MSFLFKKYESFLALYKKMDKVEKLLREHIRKKISNIKLEQERQEQVLREAIRKICFHILTQLGF